MNNKILYLAIINCLLLNINLANAQAPVLTNLNPIIGDSSNYDGVNTYTNPGSSGANQTWDFSTLSGTSGGATDYVNPSTTPSGASFPNANVCGKNSTTSVYAYYKTSATKWENVGSVSTTTMVYSNSEDIMHYPFNYNDSYSDTWLATFNSSGYDFVRTGVTTVTADGYGTVILPSGTYTNVMRVHFVQVYTDSADVSGSPYIINYTNDEYIWYKNGISAVASDYTLTSSVALNPYTGTLYLAAAPATDISEIDNGNQMFDMYPNPSTGLLNLRLNRLANAHIEITDVFGNCVFQSKNPPSNFQIDLSAQSNGVYFISVKTNEGTVNKKIVLSH